MSSAGVRVKLQYVQNYYRLRQKLCIYETEQKLLLMQVFDKEHAQACSVVIEGMYMMTEGMTVKIKLSLYKTR
jgi:hypothetical protein